MEYLKVIPKWLLVVLAVYMAILFTYAVVIGRKVTFWPPSISADNTSSNEIQSLQKANDALKVEIQHLASELEKKKLLISEAEAINAFPESVRRENLKKTATEVSRVLDTAKEKDHSLKELKEEIRGLQGNFLYRLLSFDRDARCFGDSLNFTYISSNPETQNCIKKAELAKRFLGFLAEIDFFNGAVTENPELARKELIKYQESKNFSHTGWYGRDVFKWIVIDYYEKT